MNKGWLALLARADSARQLCSCEWGIRHDEMKTFQNKCLATTRIWTYSSMWRVGLHATCMAYTPTVPHATNQVCTEYGRTYQASRCFRIGCLHFGIRIPNHSLSCVAMHVVHQVGRVMKRSLPNSMKIVSLPKYNLLYSQ